MTLPFSCCWGSRTNNWVLSLLQLCHSASGMLLRSQLTWNLIRKVWWTLDELLVAIKSSPSRIQREKGKRADVIRSLLWGRAGGRVIMVTAPWLELLYLWSTWTSWNQCYHWIFNSYLFLPSEKTEKSQWKFLFSLCFSTHQHITQFLIFFLNMPIVRAVQIIFFDLLLTFMIQYHTRHQNKYYYVNDSGSNITHGQRLEGQGCMTPGAAGEFTLKVTAVYVSITVSISWRSLS